MAGRSSAGAEVPPVSEDFILRVLDRAMARSNDALSVVTGTLGSQSSLITDLQALNMDLNRRIQVLQNELGELKQASLESDRIKADLEIRRAELALKVKRSDAAIKAVTQCLSVAMMEVGAGRRLGSGGAAPVEQAEPAVRRGARTMEELLAQVLGRISNETLTRLKEEVGMELVFELYQRVHGNEATVEEVV